MKGVYTCLLALCLCSGLRALADAGFSIRRETAPAEIRFKGIGNLGNYLLVRYYFSYQGTDSLRQNPLLNITDTIQEGRVIRVQNGGKRWEESERYLQFALVKPDSSHTIVDSFTVYLEKYNLEMNITGVKDGEIMSTMKKTKAYYEYGLLGPSGEGQNGKLNRWIYIACSLAGLILLIVMFLRRNKTKTG